MTGSLPPLAYADVSGAASEAVRGYCGWHIAPAVTETLTLDGPGSESLMLPSLYVTAITAATDDGTDLDIDTLEWSQAGYIRRGWCCWWSGRLRGVTVTLTHGHDDTPADVAQVVTAMVARAGDNPRGLVSQTRGPFSETYSKPSLLDAEKTILDRHRLPPRP